MVPTKQSWQELISSGKGLFLLVTVIVIGAGLLLDNWGEGNNGIFLTLLISFLATAAIGWATLPVLKALKVGQFIREQGPQTHFTKAGTPTMGGISFILVALVVSVVGSGFHPEVVAVSLVTLSYAIIGLIDDWQILVKKNNDGISPRAKLGLQLLTAIAFCIWLAFYNSADITTIILPFGLMLPLGALFWALAVFVFAAESNATNLTDGIDGLAAGTCAIAFLGLAAIIMTNHPELALFCAGMSGACLGFLLHNYNPAKMFMGDTGSLALGGALAAIGISTQHLFALFIISGIFFAESVSVIVQVLYYKATKDETGVGKRLLKMSPIHHHLELVGWSETQIVGIFYAIALLLSMLTFLLV